MIERRRSAPTRGGLSLAWLRTGLGVLLIALFCAAGCARSQSGGTSPDDGGEVVSVERGRASWYGGKFHGRQTASGERFDQHALTAAHRELSFGTRVRVTNLQNDKAVVVRINDRGPFGGKNRIIDVSRAAAERLGMVGEGIVPVKLEVLAD